MNWFSSFLSSSIGQKILMSLTGLFLMLFLVIHLIGNFQLLVDNIPPVILPIGIRENANLSRSSQIIFTVTDNMKKIKNFRAELDGKWLRFTNDKGRSFIYRFDERCPRGNHELKVSVDDEAGNTTTKTFHFIK